MHQGACVCCGTITQLHEGVCSAGCWIEVRVFAAVATQGDRVSAEWYARFERWLASQLPPRWRGV